MGVEYDYLASLFELSGKVAVVTGGGGVLVGAMSRALGRVEKPDLQIKHRLARDAEKKMAWLDDARVYRPDGHLKYALAFNLPKLVPLTLEWG